MSRSLAWTLALLAALACATVPPPAPPETPPAPAAAAAAEVPPPVEALPEIPLAALWETVPRPEEGLSGLAVWPGTGQRPWLLVAARDSHRLVLFDATTGELLRELGSLGERPGQFREPVDVAVAGDFAFVAERGNRRVQILGLPGLATVGFLGEGELARPAAAAVEPTAEGWALWVVEEEPVGGAATLHRFEVGRDGTGGASSRRSWPLPGQAAGAIVVGLAVSPRAGEPAIAVAAEGEPITVHRLTEDGSEEAGAAAITLFAGPLAAVAFLPCPPDGRWVAAHPGGRLSIFAAGDLGALAAVTLVPMPVPTLRGLAADPTGSGIYLTTSDSTVVALSADSGPPLACPGVFPPAAPFL